MVCFSAISVISSERSKVCANTYAQLRKDPAAETVYVETFHKLGDGAVPSMTEIKALAAQAFEELAVTSQEFGRLLRRLIPRIVVYPYRLCDGGHPVLRAHLTFCLVPLLPPTPELERLADALRRPLVVDLFETPQREAYRFPVRELTTNGLSQHAIAWELDIPQTAVQRAMARTRRMERLGMSDPYLPLAAPPDDYERLRRHKHSCYRFELLKEKEKDISPPKRVKNGTESRQQASPCHHRGGRGILHFWT